MTQGVAVTDGVIALVLGIVDFLAVALLQKARVPRINAEHDREDKSPSFKKSRRLFHVILDIVAVMFIVNSHLFLVNEFFRTNIFEVIADIFMGIAYYLVVESLLKTTVGKVMTNSIVVDSTGKRASFSRMLLRAFCRFIPFEAITFLFSDRGWHDKLSGTYVVKDKYVWEDENDVLSTYFTGEPETEPTTTLIP
jgi:hypothetical protein